MYKLTKNYFSILGSFRSTTNSWKIIKDSPQKYKGNIAFSVFCNQQPPKYGNIFSKITFEKSWNRRSEIVCNLILLFARIFSLRRGVLIGRSYVSLSHFCKFTKRLASRVPIATCLI